MQTRKRRECDWVERNERGGWLDRSNKSSGKHTMSCTSGHRCVYHTHHITCGRVQKLTARTQYRTVHDFLSSAKIAYMYSCAYFSTPDTWSQHHYHNTSITVRNPNVWPCPWQRLCFYYDSALKWRTALRTGGTGFLKLIMAETQECKRSSVLIVQKET